MLVLTVRPGERVRIGKDTWIMVTQISGQQARVGFDAPKDVPIAREKVLVRDGQKRREAGQW